MADTDVTFIDQQTIIGADFLNDVNEKKEGRIDIPSVQSQIALRESSVTGLISGGLLTQTGGSQVSIDYSAGTGVIIDAYTNRDVVSETNVSFVAGSLVIAMPQITGGVSIYVDSSGVVQQIAGVLNNTQHRDLIHLGTVIHSDGVITSVLQETRIKNASTNVLYDFLSFLGTKGRVQGFKVKATTAGLSIYDESGDLFIPNISPANLKNPNTINLPALGDAATPVVFDVKFADGSDYLTNQTVLPKFYESAPSVATALTGNSASIGYVLRILNNKIIYQLGTKLYPKADKARASLETDFDQHVFFTGAEIGLPVAQIYVGNDAIDFSDETKSGIISLVDGTSSSSSGAGNANNWIIGNAGSDYAIAPIADGVDSVAVGDNTTSKADNSIAVGKNASVDVVAINGVAVGTDSLSSGSDSVAIASKSKAIGPNSINIGGQAFGTGAVGTNALMIGTDGDAKGNNSVAIGVNASALVDDGNDVAIGAGANTGQFAFRGVALGAGANCGQPASQAIGAYASPINQGETCFSGILWATLNDPTFGTVQQYAISSNATPVTMGNSGVDGEVKWSIPTDLGLRTVPQTIFYIDADIIAINNDLSGEGAAYNIKAVFIRPSTPPTLAQIGVTTKTVIAESVAGWDVSISLDNVTGRLEIGCTGEAAKTIKWFANIKVTRSTI